jgi:hypothetical protein
VLKRSRTRSTKGRNAAQSVSEPQINAARRPTATRSSCRSGSKRAKPPGELSRHNTHRDGGHTRKALAITQAGLAKRLFAPLAETTRSANTRATFSMPATSRWRPLYSRRHGSHHRPNCHAGLIERSQPAGRIDRAPVAAARILAGRAVPEVVRSKSSPTGVTP